MNAPEQDRLNTRGVIPDALLVKLFERLKSQASIALAVSGGPDSMALMHLVRHWCTLVLYDPHKITVITVDHGLRPNSRDELLFVAAQSELLGLSHAALSWDGPKPDQAIQERARTARYGLMLALCKARGIPCLATAHTQDDQAETLLMRLQRGSGLDGLAAIPAVSDRDYVLLIRPLLHISKARLMAYLRVRAIPFVRDPGNENTAFERVRLRHAIRAFGRAGIRRHALAQSAARLQRARDALDYVVRDTLPQLFRVDPLGYGVLERKPLGLMPSEIVLRAYARALDLIGGESEPARLLKLERLLEQRASAYWQATLGGCFIKAASDHIHFYRELGRMKQAQHVIAPGQAIIWDRRFQISLSASATHCVAIRPLAEQGWTIYSAAIRNEREKPKIARLPALTTPAIWIDDMLAAAPALGWNARAFENGTIKAAITLVPSLARFLKAS